MAKNHTINVWHFSMKLNAILLCCPWLYGTLPLCAWAPLIPGICQLTWHQHAHQTFSEMRGCRQMAQWLRWRKNVLFQFAQAKHCNVNVTAKNKIKYLESNFFSRKPSSVIFLAIWLYGSVSKMYLNFAGILISYFYLYIDKAIACSANGIFSRDFWKVNWLHKKTVAFVHMNDLFKAGLWLNCHRWIPLLVVGGFGIFS